MKSESDDFDNAILQQELAHALFGSKFSFVHNAVIVLYEIKGYDTKEI